MTKMLPAKKQDVATSHAWLRMYSSTRIGVPARHVYKIIYVISALRSGEEKSK